MKPSDQRYRNMRTKAIIPLVLLVLFWHGSASAQLHFGPELRGAYIKAFGGLHPGLGFTISGGGPKRVNWQADLGGYLPITYSYSGTEGPRSLAAGDTNLRAIKFDGRSGLISAAGGLNYALGPDLNKRGTCLEAALSVDHYSYRNESNTRFVHTGQVTRSVNRFSMTQLSLRVGVAHHIDLGSGRMRFALNASLLGFNFAGFADHALQEIPLAGAAIGYQWNTTARKP